MQKSNWKEFILNDFIEFNPKIQLKKGSMATKVDMDKLAPFTRKITGYQIAEFMGGSKFSNKDTLLARITPCLENGKTAYVDILHEGEVAFGSTEFIVLRGKAKISDSLFIYYLSISPTFREKAISLMSGTSGRQRVDVNALKQISFDLPPIEEQKRIAGVLGAFDDKIELLQKQNTTLENMAKALFKSWFVDFDVVHAKQQGQPKAAVMQQYHLTEELYNLFPSSFEPSALGPIPTGWQVNPLENLARLIMGQSPTGTSYNEKGEGLPFYQGSTDFSFRFPKKRIYCTAPTRIAEKGDILISVRAPVGDLNVATEKTCIGRGLAALHPINSMYSFLYYSLLNAKKRLSVFNTEGTVFGSINRKDLSSLLLLNPSKEMMQAFNTLVLPFDIKIESNHKQIQTLTEMRDALLPRLISGKIRV